MMKRVCSTSLGLSLAAALAVLAPAAPADAQVVRISGSDARNTVNFNLGYFSLRGLDSRDEEDVLLVNLIGPPDGRDPFFQPLLFEIDDFNNWTFGGEWLYALTNNIEVGGGISYYSKDVGSIYANVTDSDGTEIFQELSLRVVPMVASVRFLPIGRGSVEPYIGAGVGFFNWRYSETGEFVDTLTNEIFTARYSKSGYAVGPVVMGGVRGVVDDAWTVGGEFRWQNALGDTDFEESGLVGRKIDLGGWNFNFTVGFRF
jgi:outer membrane protein W